MSDAGPSKLYKLTFEHRRDYLYAYVQGDQDSYEISRAFWQEVADESVRIGADRVLIHEDIIESVSMAEVFQIASEIPHMGFASIKVAFVDVYLDQQDVNSFGELVAVNRGLSGKVFNNIPDAEKWLKGR